MGLESRELFLRENKIFSGSVLRYDDAAAPHATSPVVQPYSTQFSEYSPQPYAHFKFRGPRPVAACVAELND